MPTLSRRLIQCALIHFAIGSTLGGLILIDKGIPQIYPLRQFLPAHTELMFFGWVMQMIFGVAFWIFPRSQGRRKNPEYAWIAFGLLNVGLLAFASGLNLIGRILELLSVLSFIKLIWQRAKPFEVAKSLRNR